MWRVKQKHLAVSDLEAKRGFIGDICLSLSDVPWRWLSCHFTKKNVIVPLPPLLTTQSNRNLPTSSRVVQVARDWDRTEALLASINDLTTTLMWCSPDKKKRPVPNRAQVNGDAGGVRRPCASHPSPAEPVTSALQIDFTSSTSAADVWLWRGKRRREV